MVSRRGLPRRQAPRQDHGVAPAGLHTGAVLALLLATMLNGCAATGHKAYPYFDRLAIEALPPAPVEEGDAVTSPGKLMAAGAAAGGAATLGAGLLTSLICGPYFLVCFAGTGAAALGGAAAGAVMAGSTALSDEETERVISYLANLQRTHDLGGELAAAVSARLPAARLSEPDSADARLGLQVQGLRVATGFKDTLAFWVFVEAGLEWEIDRPEPRQTSRSFVCQTEPMPLEEWLKSNNAEAEEELSHCIDDLASQIWTALQKPSPSPGAESTPDVGFGNYDPAAEGW